jgi:hypothetical protein
MASGSVPRQLRSNLSQPSRKKYDKPAFTAESGHDIPLLELIALMSVFHMLLDFDSSIHF